MRKKSVSSRVGKVQAYRRGHVWYLCYHENGQRHRPRVGPEREAARQLAAQVNAQLEVGASAALSFEPITIAELRRRWLEHHEFVRRSSVRTIQRYRTATEHLRRYLQQKPVRYASQFHASHAEQFIRHLRAVKVSSNGHAHTAPRLLMDKGLRFVLECCRTLFNYAAKRRHLSPYAENPFDTLEIVRIPIEHARPVELFTPMQERAFLDACDDWQLPLFLTLMLTGLRPGELCHLLLPDNLDLAATVLRVRNKPRLGWQVKTRNERDLPLVPELAEVLSLHIDVRVSGRATFWSRKALRSSFYGHGTLGSRFSSVLAPFAHMPGQPFLDALPEQRLEQLADQEGVSFGNHCNSIYTPAVTLWTFLLQVRSASKCCVAAVARLAVLMTVLNRPVPSAHTGAYCKARAKLPLTLLRRAARTLASEVEDQAPKSGRWHQRRVILVDGNSTQLPDTPANQTAYPQSSQQQPGRGFPMMRVVVLMAFATAVLLDAAEGPCQGKDSGETALLRTLLDSLRVGDVLVADRHYCSYFQIALLQERGVDVAARLHQLRRCDFGRGERQGRGDTMQIWLKPVCPAWMDEATYERMPERLRVRIVGVLVEQPG